MAINAHFKVDGIDGGRTANPGEIDFSSFSWGCSGQYDIATSKPSGKRRLGPLKVTKPVDVTTPLFFRLLIHNAKIGSMEISYDKPVKGGKQEVYFSVKLTNAAVINQEVSQNAGELIPHPNEVLSFIYEKVEISYKAENADGTLKGAVTTMDTIG